jgi:hypothetical protein
VLAVASVSRSGRPVATPVVTTLTRLAKDVELVLFCGRSSAVELVKLLRAALPRHQIVSVLITLDADRPVPPEAATIEDLLNDGVLPIAVFPDDTEQSALAAAMRQLAHLFDADEVLTVNSTGVKAVRDRTWLQSAHADDVCLWCTDAQPCESHDPILVGCVT